MIDRYCAAKLSTIRRDFDRHRTAIRAHDSKAAEKTWLDCERWLGCVEALNVEEHRRVADWREVLAELAKTVETQVTAKHRPNGLWPMPPAVRERYERDMIEVDAARAVLAEMDAVLGRGE